MARTQSNMSPLSTAAPDFKLRGTDGAIYKLEDFDYAELLVIAFICNHCPFVKHIRAGLARFGADCRKLGVALVAINSNDTEAYPQDDMEHMKLEVTSAGYVFPYLLDATQQTAKAFGAACTPDFFLYDRARTLIYRGQFDDSRPGNGVAVTGQDLRNAVQAALDGRMVNSEQKPSMGCNIKWKPGNAR
jgi:peroxiredoxin